MKKFLAAILGICMLGAMCLAGCNNEDGPGPDPTPGGDTTLEVTGDEIQNDNASFEYIFNELYNPNTLVDKENGFETASDIKGGRFFINGNYVKSFTKIGSRQDIRLELYNDTAARIVSVSAGMEFTIPTSEKIDVDYTIADYRIQYTFGDSILTASAESKNPYTSISDGWYVYVNEWAIRHLVNMKYYNNQNLTLLNEDDLGFEITPVDPITKTSDGTRAYPTVKEGNVTMRPGYEIYRFDIEINDPGDITHPFYHIGLIHQKSDARFFSLFVLKSETNKAEMMDKIMMSWKPISAKGLQRNYFKPGAAKEDPHWNEETLNFFRKFTTQSKKSWGVFSYSMPGEASKLHPGQEDYDKYLKSSRLVQQYIEDEVWGGKKYDIYMTYTHLGWGSNYAAVSGNHHYYPVDMSIALAHGNGFDGKPVLEFTYQFTSNNNLVDEEITPLFDIMRGKYDEYFRRLGNDIKTYGKPVMFRLNNEMNTDWTSYSGIMNLLDPDIFTATWRRLYNIFIEQGCDNVIWVWNPIADSAPYSGWGEDLAYFPGVDYVQLLGGTCYEFNNYNGDVASQIKSFKTYYSGLYTKNKPFFSEWSMIIGEFACGSGGDATGELGRNRAEQAAWVKGMFDELNAENPADYVKQIKGLIWFNCNDYGGTGKFGITNRLKFANAPNDPLVRPGEDYSDLAETWQAFRDGFAAEAARD